jgi:hypothetical protein
MNEVEVAPLRSLDEFIMGESRFQMPDINNPEKWINRIVNNLLYYQTNYFISAIIIFLLIGFLHPGKMFLGILTMAILFGLLYYFSSTQVQLKTLKKNHPAVVMLGTFSVGYFVIYMMGCILVFLSGVILPFIFMVVHASLRLRNIKNKVSNVAETLGMGKKTPMGIFLDEFGIEPEIKYM